RHSRRTSAGRVGDRWGDDAGAGSRQRRRRLVGSDGRGSGRPRRRPRVRVTLIVQKYGGTSVGSAEGIVRGAERVVAAAGAGHQVCVGVSAMGNTTDELIDLARQIAPTPHARELDMLLTAGERISIALVSMAILELGRDAMSFTGSQAGILTGTTHGKARIPEVRAPRVREAPEAGPSARVAGCQAR